MAVSEHPYHRSLAPMMWVFVGLASLELVVCHFLLALWDWRVALGASLVSFTGLVWLIGAIRSFCRLPVVVDGEWVTFRAGRIAGIEVPISDIAEVRSQWDSAELRRKDVLKLSLIAYPNVLVELSEPVCARRRMIRAIAHRLDDPAAFLSAVAAKA